MTNNDPFGVSFSPQQQSGQPGAPGQRQTPIQQAIQTLSLRIPQHAGASAFTAQPLLNSAGGQGLTDPNSANTLEMLKRLLFGGRFNTMPMPRDPGTPPPMSAPPLGGNDPAPGGFGGAPPFTPFFRPGQTGVPNGPAPTSFNPGASTPPLPPQFTPGDQSGPRAPEQPQAALPPMGGGRPDAQMPPWMPNERRQV